MNQQPSTEEYGKRGYLNTDFRIFHLKDTLKNEFEFHYHEFHKITIFLKGNVRYFVEGKSYELEPYDIVLVNRNDIHRVETDPSVPYERIIIYISPRFMETYQTKDYDLSDCFLRAKAEHSNVLRIPSSEKSTLLHATHRLEHSFDDTGYASELYRQTLFLEFMIQLNRTVQNHRLGYLDHGLANPKIVEILNYINTHLTEPLPIDFLAQTFFPEQISHDAPVQIRNRIHHWKLHYLPSSALGKRFHCHRHERHGSLFCIRIP